MNTWNFDIVYKARKRIIKAELIFNSDQVQRIKVHGSKSFIVLQNNYPLLLRKNKASVRIKWQLVNGTIPDAGLLMDIIHYLEERIKHPDQ